MTEYNPFRRIPESVPATFIYWKTLPLVGPLLRSSVWTLISQVIPNQGNLGRVVQEIARMRGDQAVELAQKIYFDNPGLDTLTVRELAKIGLAVGGVGRLVVRAKDLIPLKNHKHSQSSKVLTGTLRGYDTLLLGGLTVGTTLGYFTGGKVHTHLWWDSKNPNRVQLPIEHPEPAVRRFQVPQNLGDLAADIDDLYWADAYGQCLKVTRVGQGESRRWLVSLPGTDHAEIRSRHNAADLEANLQEELGIASAMRIGTVQIIHQAMQAEGIPETDRVREKVLICGHSQGGIIAAALAATEPKSLGFSVSAVITLGSPARRFSVRPEVHMLSVEHEQDIVPSLDGAPRKESDQRVVVRRSLIRPRRGPLFYAHSSSTYTTTVRQLEKQNRVAGWGRQKNVVEQLQTYLPQAEEPTRVTHHYTWQDLIGANEDSTWEKYLELRSLEIEPVSFGGEVTSSNLPARPAKIVQKVAKSLSEMSQGSPNG